MNDREDAAEVVDRLGRLVHVARHELHRHHERDHRERQREQEHRAPPEVLEQDPRAQRPERGDRAADRRPQRDRLRPRRARPERRDQRERRRVRHAGGEAAEDPGARSARPRSAPRRRGSPPGSSAASRGRAAACARSGRRPRRSRGPRRRARASSRPRSGSARSATTSKCCADRRQRDVGDREAEVRDGGDGDQRAEDEPACAGVPEPLFALSWRALRTPRGRPTTDG